MMIVSDDSGVVNTLEASLTDDARVIIYDRHMFIVQATDSKSVKQEVNGSVILSPLVFHC